MLYPNKNILLYTAIGDAYCLAVEYIKDKEYINKCLEFKRYLKHPSHNNKPGTYSDDCQQSTGNALVLLDGSFTALNFANHWVNIFKNDPRDAYSRKFQKFLEEVSDGKEFLEKIQPDSNKNGAAMRASPLGVLKSPQKVLEVATLQAAITHDTPGGRFGAQAVALMSHYFLYQPTPITREYLSDFLHLHLKNIIKSDSLFAGVFIDEYDGPACGPEVGLVTAKVAFEILTSSKSLLEMLTKCIVPNSDTDTIGAITLGIGSSRMKDNLPQFMHDQLEVGTKYGSQFLIDIGTKLMEKYNI
jgi:ADP-ribosylglycohydrolase